MNEKINYIKHLKEIHAFFSEDNRLSPWHISLYYALFQMWNQYKFQTPLSISRSEVMSASKIGSANTYLKCLKELDKWGYIKYVPSRNPMKGSQVYLYKINISTDTTSDTSTGTSSDTCPVQHLRPSLNNTKLNKTKETIKTNKTIDEQKNKKNQELLFSKKEVDKTTKQKHSFPSTLQEVEIYFSEKKFATAEAEKFYNYFESNGWLVGGRTKMKNWKAAANNWILNSIKFNPKLHQEKKTYLHVDQNKDYSIPL